MDEPNNDIDTETLQAQIDLSMARAQNLVASWLSASAPSSLTRSSSSRAANAEAELQAIIRRPPRRVSCTSSKEEERDAPHGKWRRTARGRDRPTRMDRRRKKKNDGAEESRAGAIRKRVRVDPFEPGGKKTKKKRKEKEKRKQAEGETALAEGDVAMEGPTATGDATTRPGAKRKRKKVLLEGSLAGPAVGGGEARSEDRDADVGQQRPGPSMQSLLDEWGGLWNHQQRSRSGTPGSSFSGISPDVDAAPTSGSPKQRPSPSISPIQQPPSFLPASSILNLTGPPPTAPKKMEGGALVRKRRRKRKKKKPAGDQQTGNINDPP
ncbi:hypothetical protein BC826DRAFT_1102966 [Russula brevipes]|nr:hypothetical protein BC826DRAFT_1102966 [Russula brevipes]